MPEPTIILDLELRIRYEEKDQQGRPSKTFCANYLVQVIDFIKMMNKFCDKASYSLTFFPRASLSNLIGQDVTRRTDLRLWRNGN